MTEQNGFVVECGAQTCFRRIAVLPKNIGSVILSDGEATVFASVAKEDDCELPECGVELGYATTSRTESREWLEANVEPARIHAL